jgi:hypothetical protein
MRREFGQKLVERGPSWFRMWDGFAHGDGWFDILWMLNEDLEPLAAAAEKHRPPVRSLTSQTEIRRTSCLQLESLRRVAHTLTTFGFRRKRSN